MTRTLLLALALAGAPLATAPLATAQAADLAVTAPFARASMGSGPGAAYLTIEAGDTPDRLLSVTSPRAAHVALHSMMMQGDVMRMREVDAIDIPPRGKVTLAPGGLHLMLEGLKTPLRQGETLPLVLRFEKAGERTVEAPVRAPGATR